MGAGCTHPSSAAHQQSETRPAACRPERRVLLCRSISQASTVPALAHSPQAELVPALAAAGAALVGEVLIQRRRQFVLRPQAGVIAAHTWPAAEGHGANSGVPGMRQTCQARAPATWQCTVALN